jgi:hypothetical protein
VASDIVDDLATARGMAHMYRLLHVEMIYDRRNVVGVMIHIMAVPDLTRPSMSAPVVRDDPETLGQKEEHLGIPVICTERPSVMKENDLCITRAPVLIENIDAILRCDKSHFRFSGEVFAVNRCRVSCVVLLVATGQANVLLLLSDGVR